ncbi:helix-turn-helix transcriptional regulator [Streptomyces sp. NBC_00191]
MTTLNRPGTPDGHVCGIDTAMEVIGGKWKVLILWALHEHPHRRFGELRRLLPGITEKVLASHLRELEADGVVHRVSYDEVPPRVEYSLTEDGMRLKCSRSCRTSVVVRRGSRASCGCEPGRPSRGWCS